MFSFEELKEKWEDKIVAFELFDELLEALFEKNESEEEHPYFFEDLGREEDGTTKWNCNNNKCLKKKGSVISECDYFVFYTKN